MNTFRVPFIQAPPIPHGQPPPSAKPIGSTFNRDDLKQYSHDWAGILSAKLTSAPKDAPEQSVASRILEACMKMRVRGDIPERIYLGKLEWSQFERDVIEPARRSWRFSGVMDVLEHRSVEWNGYLVVPIDEDRYFMVEGVQESGCETGLRMERDAIAAKADTLKRERDEARAAIEMGQRNCDAEYERLKEERDRAVGALKESRAEVARLEGDRGSFTGEPCPTCGGMIGCTDCGNTGDEWMTWQAQFERVAANNRLMITDRDAWQAKAQQFAAEIVFLEKALADAQGEQAEMARAHDRLLGLLENARETAPPGLAGAITEQLQGATCVEIEGRRVALS